MLAAFDDAIDGLAENLKKKPNFHSWAMKLRAEIIAALSLHDDKEFFRVSTSDVDLIRRMQDNFILIILF